MNATFLGLVGFDFTRMAALNRASSGFCLNGDGNDDNNNVESCFWLGLMGLPFTRVVTLCGLSSWIFNDDNNGDNDVKFLLGFSWMLMFLGRGIGMWNMMGVVVAVCVVSVVKNMARGKQRRSAQRRESGLGDSIFSRILFVYLNLLVFF